MCCMLVQTAIRTSTVLVLYYTTICRVSLLRVRTANKLTFDGSKINSGGMAFETTVRGTRVHE